MTEMSFVIRNCEPLDLINYESRSSSGRKGRRGKGRNSRFRARKLPIWAGKGGKTDKERMN